MGDRFKRWWAEQGATYNERRRKRYAEDPDYRARARGQSKPPRPSAPESEWTSQTVFTASGAPLTVFSVAALAAAWPCVGGRPGAASGGDFAGVV